MTFLPYPLPTLGVLAQNPLLASLWAEVPELLLQKDWPDCDYWQSRAAKIHSWPEALRFIPDQRIGQRRKRTLAKQKLDPKAPTLRRYETAICEAAEIPTRIADLHDYFNALIWLKFPLAKFALHRKTWLSYQDGAQEVQSHRRSLMADALTRFDEGGMLYVPESQDNRAEVFSLFQAHDDLRKEAFCAKNAHRFAVFGHGLLEAWCDGKRGFTASLFIVDTPDECRHDTLDFLLAKSLTSLEQAQGNFGTMSFDAWLRS